MTTLTQVLESPELSARFWPVLEGLVRGLAVSRVRTSLVLDHVARGAGLTVSKDEVLTAINEEARDNPGQEKAVFDYYRLTPGASGRLAAELLAEKAIDRVLSQAKVTERRVPRDEFRAICAGEGLVYEQKSAKRAV